MENMSTPVSKDLCIFDMQRFCIHDGPGIRTVAFFKGCPLRCQWCQNPESMTSAPAIAFYADRCQGCGQCTKVCSQNAIVNGPERVDRQRCNACGQCAKECPHEALRLVGRQEGVAALTEQMLADKSYFDATQGGVTLSGGEPLLQANAAVQLLRLCKEAGVHTVVETCGAVPWTAFEKVAPHVDRFLFDLKAGQEILHVQLTGHALQPIWDNATRLTKRGHTVTFRMPVVPGLNDTPESLDGIAAFVKSIMPAPRLELLKYHGGGVKKAERLGLPLGSHTPSSSEADIALARAREILQHAGVHVTIPAQDSSGTSTSLPLFPERVQRLREAVCSATPSICVERARLVTQYFRDRRNRNKPVIIQKAEALRQVLQKRSARIYPDELLVGSFSSYRVGGSLFPELHGVAVCEDLLAFNTRSLNPLHLDGRDARELAMRIIPYWMLRFLSWKAFPLSRAFAFVMEQLRADHYLINETGGIAHFVPDYPKLLRLGTAGIAKEAQRLHSAASNPETQALYKAVQIVCDGLAELSAAYVLRARELAQTETDQRRQDELLEVARICESVPQHPAQSFQEALQSILFVQIALNQESLDNSISPGRLDQVLWPYFHADQQAGRITVDRARELVGCFTVKMSEIIPVFSRRVTRFHGGMFNGQVVVVGGTDAQGNDVTNALTDLFLDAMDELRMRQPNYHARIHSGSPARYINRVADMLLRGSAAPSLMNDDVIVPTLVGRGMPVERARDYSPVGCVEPVSCGATFGSTDAAIVNLLLPFERALGLKKPRAGKKPAEQCASVDELFDLFRRELQAVVAKLIQDLHAVERANAVFHPTPLSSLMLEGCLESGVDASSGGALFNASGVQGVGVADLADSFAAVERVVFVDKRCTMSELLHALRRNFVGTGELRGYLLRAPKYGNDHVYADRFAQLIMTTFADMLARHENTRGGKYLAGFYSVTAHEYLGSRTRALPSGRRAKMPLASGLSPVNGVDRLGPTAALSSVAKLNLVDTARNGINVNIKIDRRALGEASEVEAMSGLIRGYFHQGGMQVQINAMDPATLLDARAHPENHPWLLVRVSGYSAYFNDLSPEMRDEIIMRTVHAC